ncbi:MAG: hypothetical protein U9P72_08785 [Campylobacterota bacterium]|nr:hypothetical protein [Campylobacterota bacterium]
MRSRDGDFNLSFAIFSLISFTLSILHADEYLISYRYVVKDAILYNEQLYISKTMRKCIGEEQDSIFLENDNSKNLKEIVNKNRIIFIDFIHKIGLKVNHKEKTVNSQNHSTTILTLKTTCFKVDFNENFARIAPLK